MGLVLNNMTKYKWNSVEGLVLNNMTKYKWNSVEWFSAQ